MKLLFASSDPVLVERFKVKLSSAGIASEVRRLADSNDLRLPCYPELWVSQERHFQTAVDLFAHFQSTRY
jgi:hypothetical protein